MAFTMPDYPVSRPEQVNPFNAALQQAFKTYGQGLQAAYAKPNMEQALQKALLENIWNPKIWQSEIGLRGAQAGLAGSEATKNQFLVKNPQYINPEGLLISQAIGQGRGGQGSSGDQGTPQRPDYGSNNQASPQQVQQIAQNANGAGQGYQPTPQEQQQMGQMHPGQSMVLGQQGNVNGAQHPAGSNAYDPNALAYNPPGLPAPTMLNNILWAKGYTKDPATVAQLELAQKQAEKYQNVNVDKNNQFNDQAIVANQSTVDAHKFLDALDRASELETGHWFGKTPALRDATQEMEAYGNAMAASATQLFKDGKAIHESDITLNQLAKPNRLQNKDVAFDLANGVIAKNDRLKERQQAYAFATQQKIKPEIMDAMWNKFETDRPYIDPETKMPNDSYKGTWKDYFTPEAVNAFVNGRDYNPPNQIVLQGMNWEKNDLKTIKDWSYKNHLDPKQFEKKNIYKHAKEEGMTLAQFKQELMKRGAFKNG